MTPKIRGYKEGIITKDLISVAGTGFKKGDTVRYKKMKVHKDKDGFLLYEYEFHYLDLDNKNLVRSPELFIEGEPSINFREEFKKNKK